MQPALHRGTAIQAQTDTLAKRFADSVRRNAQDTQTPTNATMDKEYELREVKYQAQRYLETKSPYGLQMAVEAARMAGATDDEIQAAFESAELQN